jgi:hypothetical protein
LHDEREFCPAFHDIAGASPSDAEWRKYLPYDPSIRILSFIPYAITRRFGSGNIDLVERE